MSRREKGEGSIYYDKKRKQWIASYDIGFDPVTGKRVRKTIRCEKRKEAVTRINELIYKYNSGIINTKPVVTIGDMAQFIVNTKLDSGEIIRSTYIRHQSTIKRLSFLYDVPVQQADEAIIRKYLSSIKEYSDSLITKQYQMLDRVFKKAIAKELITKNPLVDINKYKSTQVAVKVRALSLEEELKLIDVLTTYNNKYRYANAMLLMLFTGMRMGEILALTVKDIDFGKGIINVYRSITREEHGKPCLGNKTKTTNGVRKIIITEDIKKVLIKAIDNKYKWSDLLFSYYGNPISTTYVYSQFQLLLKKYEILDDSYDGKVTLHSLRHTYATRCIEDGMPSIVLRDILGHSDIDITLNTYAEVFNSFQNEKVEETRQKAVSRGIVISKI